MAFLDSGEVKVYPSTRRDKSKQYDARPVTEFQLVSLVNRLIDKDAFMITTSFTPSEGQYVEFNIHGYYFKVDGDQAIAAVQSETPSATDIYAHIWLDDSTSMVELFGQDDDSTYTGIKFTYRADRDDSTDESRKNLPHYTLRILMKNSSGTWEIPEASKSRFTGDVLEGVSVDKIDLTVLDGGVVTIS